MVFLITRYALVIVQEVATSVENQSLVVHFDRLWMMRRMPVNHICCAEVDQPVSEITLLSRDFIPPISAPVN